MRLIVQLILSLSIWSNLVWANSYTDGLHFMKDPNLAIERQDISLGLDQITVSYVLNNTSNSDIIETLVFTLPMQNQFSLLVNDMPVSYNLVQRAISDDGIDISDFLKSLGLAFDPVSAMHNMDASPNREILRKKLLKTHLIDAKDDTPKWFVKTFYYWQQKFPAKTSIRIQHSYKPALNVKNIKVKSLSEFFKVPLTLVKKLFLQEENAANLLKTQVEKHNPEIASFCPTNYDYLQIIGNSKFENKNRSLNGKEIKYNFQPGSTWLTTVKHFSLTITPSENMHPILCWNEALKRKADNSLFFEANNYVSLKDIDVLYLPRLDLEKADN